MKAKYGPELAFAAVGSVVLIFLGCVLPFEIAFYLLAGWGFFLARVLPQVTVSPNGVLSGLAAFAGFSIGMHVLLRWLYRATATDEPVGLDRRWQRRWTLGLAVLVVLMFVAGIATVGGLHQIGWLMTSDSLLSNTRIPANRTVSSNNLRQIALGLLNHNDGKITLPAGFTTDRAGRPLHGWQAAILPYLEQEHLFQSIRFDLPWDDPINQPAYRKRLTFYQSPSFEGQIEAGGYSLSHYAGNLLVLPPNQGLIIPRDFLDGISNTILTGEVAAGFRPWGHPLNFRDLGKGIHKTADAFAGPGTNGATQFSFADGSVRPIRNDISPAVLKALATPAGREDVSGVE